MPDRRRVFVKICGVRDEEAAQAAGEAGADAVGFVFYRPSRRWLEPWRAAQLGALLPEPVWRVGVFVDAPPEEVAATAAAARLTAVQLHGAETPAVAAALRRRLGIRVIKALGLASPADLERGRAWAEAPPDFFLLDAAPPAAAGAGLVGTRPNPPRSGADGGGGGEAIPGGSGRTFDWRWAARAAEVLPAPFLLAGGLTPTNVAEALAVARPAGVDVSSGVERDGRKDPALIRSFVEAVRRWEAGAAGAAATNADAAAADAAATNADAVAADAAAGGGRSAAPRWPSG